MNLFEDWNISRLFLFNSNIKHNPKVAQEADTSYNIVVGHRIESYNTYVSKDLNLDGTVNAQDRLVTRLVSDVSDGI